MVDSLYRPLADGSFTAPAASATVHSLLTISEGATRVRLQNVHTSNKVYLKWNGTAAAADSYALWPWEWKEYEYEAAELKKIQIIGTGAETVFAIQEGTG